MKKKEKQIDYKELCKVYEDIIDDRSEAIGRCHTLIEKLNKENDHLLGKVIVSDLKLQGKELKISNLELDRIVLVTAFLISLILLYIK